MALVDYDIEDNQIDVKGTDEFGDFFISAACLPWINGVHAGISWAVSWHYKKIVKQLRKNEEVKIWAYSMGGSFALELTRRLTKDGFHVFCLTRGAYPVHLIRQDFHGGTICREYGNDIVTKLFPWFRFPFESVRHEGPRRRWWKFSLKDHTSY